MLPARRAQNRDGEKGQTHSQSRKAAGQARVRAGLVIKKSQGVGTVAQRHQLLDKEGDVPARKRQYELPRLLAAVRTTRIDLTGRIGNSNDCNIIEAHVRVLSSTNFTLARLRHSW